MEEISAQGINVIRLPIAPQTLDPNDPQGRGDIRQGGVLKNHESVRAENARQALEDFIVLADQNNLQVIIDIHSCSNYVGWRAGRLDATPPYVDASRDNYEYTREDYSCGPAGAGVTVHEYNQSRWLEDLREIAGLSNKLGVDNILAIDIFNEPWDYTWQQWKALAESAFEAINSVNSDILIMVEGIGSELSNGTSVPHGDQSSNPNWGENLFPAANDPLNIPRDLLIMSPHTYGPSVFVQRQFMDPAQPQCAGLEGDQAGDADCNIVIDPAKLEAGWEEHFGFLKDMGYAVVIGEFGGHFEWPTGAPQRDQDRWGHITNHVDEEWQNAFVDYMIKRDIKGCYWSINPESGDTGGLYLHAYDPVSNPSGWGTWQGLDNAKLTLLKRLWND
jgi:endoglucanase